MRSLFARRRLLCAALAVGATFGSADAQGFGRAQSLPGGPFLATTPSQGFVRAGPSFPPDGADGGFVPFREGWREPPRSNAGWRTERGPCFYRPCRWPPGTPSPAPPGPPPRIIARAPPAHASVAPPQPPRFVAHAPPARRFITPPPPPPPAPLARALPPRAGETRYRRGEVLVETTRAIPPATIALILARHGVSEAEVDNIDLLGTSLRLWRFPETREVAGVVRELGGEASLLRVQPNYVYRVSQEPVTTSPSPVPAAAPSPPQYSLVRLHVDPSLDAPAGAPVRVAVIDTAIDETHPDLAGAVAEQEDFIHDPRQVHSMDHGTSIAGAIAARGRVKGVAPSVRILSARAFDSDGTGETRTVIEALEWAWKSDARIVNMSFAGPLDSGLLHSAIAAAYAKGVMLVGAAGNDGPRSPPLYPAADPYVLAVTATDSDDRLYDMANVGSYVSIAAPGVDVLLPAPEASYTEETGTSVSAALVSGVVALMLERRPGAAPAQLRQWLVTTAEPLAGGGTMSPFAGLADARRAVSAVEAAAALK